MNLKIGLFLISLLFLSTNSSVLAQDTTANPTSTPTPVILPTSTPTKQPLWNRIFDRKQDKKQNKEDQKETRQQAKITTASVRAQKIFAQMRSVLTKRFESLQNTKTKIEARLADKKAKNPDLDISAAQAQLAKFDTTKYQADLAALDAVIARTQASDKPLSLIKDVRQAVQVVRTDLNDLRQILSDSLRLVIKTK